MAWACFSEKANRSMRPVRAASTFVGLLDDRDHLIDVVQRDLQALQDVGALLGAGQLEAGPPCDHFLAVLDEVLEHLLQREGLRQALHQGEVHHAECRLKLRVREELVEDDLGGNALSQVDDDPHPMPVGLVVEVDDAVDLPLLHQVGDAHDEG